MALNPGALFPTQTLPDAAYPLGKAKNQAVLNDGTGTPWEARIINDIFGFQQAMLLKGEVTASGAADTATASQYLEALDYLYGSRGALGQYAISGTPAAGERFSLTQDFTDGLSLNGESVGHSVSVPRKGYYWCSSVLNYQRLGGGGSSLKVGIYVNGVAKQTSHEVQPLDELVASLGCACLVSVSDPATQRIDLRLSFGGITTVDVGSILSIFRVAPST